jgi:hypothetical protein
MLQLIDSLPSVLFRYINSLTTFRFQTLYVCDLRPENRAKSAFLFAKEKLEGLNALLK